MTPVPLEVAQEVGVVKVLFPPLLLLRVEYRVVSFLFIDYDSSSLPLPLLSEAHISDLCLLADPHV